MKVMMSRMLLSSWYSSAAQRTYYLCYKAQGSGRAKGRTWIAATNCMCRCVLLPSPWLAFARHSVPARVTQGKFRIRFEVLMVWIRRWLVFWVVAPCSLVEVCLRFRGPCYLHQQGDEAWGNKDLWNVGKLLPDYTALQPTRQPSKI
jgi:hypothetical protein